MSLCLTKVTTDGPAPLAKRFEPAGGVLKKTASAQLTRGSIEIVTVETLAELSPLVMGLSMRQALVFGVPKNRQARRLTLASQRRAGDTNVIARTKEDFEWPEGAGIVIVRP